MNTILDNRVKELNDAICSRVKGHSIHVEGICIEAKSGDETINVNEKSEPVFFDDKVGIYLYHKKISVNFSILRKQGKKTTYYGKAACVVYCCCTPRNFYDLLTGIMGEFNHIEVNDIDFDQNKILRAETGAKDFDYSGKNIFALRYTINYSTDNCSEICL